MRGGAFLMGLLICMIKHLDVLNFICQVDSHLQSEFMSCWSTSQSAGVFISLYRIRSSANSLTSDFTQSGRSFIYIPKKVGGRVPFLVELRITLVSWWTLVRRWQPVVAVQLRNPLSNPCIVPVFQDNLILQKAVGGGPGQKALLKSMMQRSMRPQLSRMPARSFTSPASWVSQDLPLLKPCCLSHSMECLSMWFMMLLWIIYMFKLLTCDAG